MYSFQTLEIYNSKSLVSKAVLPKKTNKHMNYYYVYHVLY